MKLRRTWGTRIVPGSGLCRVDEWSGRTVRVVQGAVGVEGFAGGFFEEDFVVAEEMVDFVALFEGDEEDFAVAFAPGVAEVLRGEEDGWGVGEGAAEEHGGGAAVDERDVAAEVEGDGGAVGLVAVEEDLVLSWEME